MMMMRLKFIAIVILSIEISNSQQPPKYYHTDIECTASSTCLFPYCNLNKFLDYKSTIDAGCFVLRPLSKIFVQQVTMRRDEVEPLYYNTISTSPIYDWCEIMLNAEGNPIYMFIVQLFSNTVPSLLHKCPYWGLVTAFNLTLNMDKFFTFYAPGDYKNVLLIFDDVDSEIFKLRIYTSVF